MNISITGEMLVRSVLTGIIVMSVVELIKKWKWLPVPRGLRNFIAWVDGADALAWIFKGFVVTLIWVNPTVRETTASFFAPVAPVASTTLATVTSIRISPAMIFFGIFFIIIIMLFGKAVIRGFVQLFEMETKPKKSKKKKLPRLSP